MENSKTIKKSYLIDEINDNEGETFGYLVDLSEEEAKVLQEKIITLNKTFGWEILSIREQDYTQEEIKIINKTADNEYKKRMARYKFQPGILEECLKSEDNYFVLDQCFYKGIGLKEEK